MSGIEKLMELINRPGTPAPEVVYMVRPLAVSALEALEAKAPLGAEVRDLRAILAEPQEQLWAIHSVGPNQVFPCLNKEDAEQRAKELVEACEKMGEGREHWPSIAVNVVKSPWGPVDHFAIMAEDWQTEAGRLRQLAVDLTTERDRLRDQVATLQAHPNSWQSGYNEGRRMGHKSLLETRSLDARLAGFWRSLEEMPPEDVPLVVLRDAGTVGNGEHPGHRTGRWLELTTALTKMFACDALSTGQVIGWVTAEEFQGLKALIAEQKAQ